jgi:hypothetical protein
MGEIATLANGVSVYGWSDGQYYASNTWSNIAAVLEYYDVDMCGGHAANGDYHHHGTQARGQRRGGGGHQAPPPPFCFPPQTQKAAGTLSTIRVRGAVALG